MIKLAVSGCQGRMGQRITQLALADSELQIKTLLERPDHPQINEKVHDITIQSSLSALKGCDVLIEFTTPTSTLEHLEFCRQNAIKMVIGTTGLSPSEVEQIKNASKSIAIVFAYNMSIGVNILFKLAQQLAQATPDNYSVKIVEAHHVHKKDAPSGTAKTLSEKIQGSSTKKIDSIQSIREGEIIGDHKVIFESPDDTITIEHHAKTRDIFVKGALVAAKFLHNKNKGLFTMQDVLGLS